MKVIVDTSAWSLALRKKNFDLNNSYVIELKELISEGRIQMIGPVRQELLSGIKSVKQFNDLRNKLSFFPDYLVETTDYIEAANIYNKCKANGIQGSNTDFLIAAIAINNHLAIFTTDKDFKNFQKILKQIRLVKPRNE